MAQQRAATPATGGQQTRRFMRNRRSSQSGQTFPELLPSIGGRRERHQRTAGTLLPRGGGFAGAMNEAIARRRRRQGQAAANQPQAHVMQTAPGDAEVGRIDPATGQLRATAGQANATAHLTGQEMDDRLTRLEATGQSEQGHRMLFSDGDKGYVNWAGRPQHELQRIAAQQSANRGRRSRLQASRDARRFGIPEFQAGQAQAAAPPPMLPPAGGQSVAQEQGPMQQAVQRGPLNNAENMQYAVQQGPLNNAENMQYAAGGGVPGLDRQFTRSEMLGQRNPNRRMDLFQQMQDAQRQRTAPTMDELISQSAQQALQSGDTGRFDQIMQQHAQRQMIEQGGRLPQQQEPLSPQDQARRKIAGQYNTAHGQSAAEGAFGDDPASNMMADPDVAEGVGEWRQNGTIPPGLKSQLDAFSRDWTGNDDWDASSLPFSLGSLNEQARRFADAKGLPFAMVLQYLQEQESGQASSQQRRAAQPVANAQQLNSIPSL